MTGFDEILQFVGDTDPAMRVLLVVFAVLAGLAGRLIGQKVSEQAKLLVFFAIFLLGGSTCLAAVYLVAAAKVKGGAELPSALPERGSRSLSWLTSVVLAQDRSGWVFCGKFDEETGTVRAWADNVIPETPASRARLPQPGSRLKAVGAVDVYSDQPRFTALGFRWVLADVAFTVPNGRLVVVRRCRLFGDNGWCHVQQRG